MKNIASLTGFYKI